MFKLNSQRAMRLSLAGAGATVLCLVLVTRVFVAFDARRAKLVKTTVEPVNGLVQVDTSFDARVAFLDAPVAVIASIRNTGTASETISISADGRPLCAVVVPPASSTRADCVAIEGWTTRAGHVMDFRGTTNAWTLDYFELATHHGSSTRGLYLLVAPDVPEVDTRVTRAGPVSIALAWFAIVAVWLVPIRRQWPPAAIRLHRTLCGAAALFLVAAAVSPWLSPFLVLISAMSFVKVTAMFLAPQLWELGVWLRERWLAVLRYSRRWRTVLAAAATAAVVLLAFGVVVRAAANNLDGQYSGLLRVSGEGFDRVPFLHDRADVRQSLKLDPWEGYDAQFQYFAIYDPLLRRYSAEPQRYREVVDSPPYRFGRMGFPLIARLIAGNRWEWYPITMVALVWVGVGMSAFALALLAQHAGASAAWGLLALAIPGFWQSVQVALPEPIAAALLLLGYLSVVQKRIVLAAVLFALSLLVRETGLVFVLALALLTRPGELSWRSRALLACSGLTVIVWRLYVAWVLWPEWGWQGLFYSPHVMTVPFAGLAGLWSDLVSGRYHPGVPDLARGAAWFSILLVGVCIAAWFVARASGRVIGAALVVYGLIALSFTYSMVWNHVANSQRASYEVFLLLAVATVSLRAARPAMKATLAACWTGAALYLLLGSHDVLFIRGALFPWT